MISIKTPCVLVADADVLLKRAFASLLTLGSDLEIVVSEAKDVQDLLDDISKTKPDAVLFSESIPFSHMDSLSHLLTIHPMPKVIIVSEDSNWIHIFSQEDRLVTDLSDLLSVIKPV
jgi:DNA-binding NarL/FixJ family response regulator